MRAGRLRHQIELQSPTTELDAAGGPCLTWKTYASRRAEITPKQGRESWEANTIESFQFHEIRIRYVPGVTSEHRIKVCKDGRIFTIRAIANIKERNRDLVLTALEYREQGTY